MIFVTVGTHEQPFNRLIQKVDGKNMLQIKRGGCEDYISAESLVEYIHGLPVKNIEFATPEDCRKEA